MTMAAPLSFFTKNLLLILVLFAALNSNAAAVKNPIEQIKVNKSRLVISPNVVTANDVIVISFPRQHPQKMSIKSPSDEWFVVHEESEKVYFLPQDEFSYATSSQEKVAEIMGVKWIDGKRVIGPVFNEPGEYLIYMADNLETEPENTFYLTGTVIYRK